jgi:uncharacterized protein (TIGR03663 family)
VYRYDPHEYHGPSLYYLTLPSAWLSGARRFADTTEATYRIVPAILGVGLILLLPLLRDGLGRGAILAAGVFTAVSPAMVFYSRYYIHEIPLVLFTLLLLASLWRAARSKRVGWCLLTGLALGLMHATKETFVFVLAAGAGAAALTWAWSRWRDGARADFAGLARPRCWLWAAAVAILVSLVLFSSFFTNVSGPLDSLRTYVPWLSRAGGASPHVHPWHYYLKLLLWYRVGQGPVWTEALVVSLALVGWIAALGSRGPGASDGAGGAGFSAPLVRFIGFYSLLLAGIYSAIPYKTPWCLLGFLHGFILLAGAGTVVVLRWAGPGWRRVGVAAVLAAATVQLGVQAWRASYPYCDSQRNPYVYAHTLSDLLNLVERAEQVAALSPQGHDLPVRVWVRDGVAWPLPWYLRRFNRVEWDPQPNLDPRFALVIVSLSLEDTAQEKLGATHAEAGHYGLRPGGGGLLGLFVERKLWDAYLRSPRPRE